MFRKKLLSPNEYKQMPWKNGQGISTEIAIYPKDALFSTNTFLWRISSAKIFQNNTFSKFAGFDRLLTVWEGRGIKLNNLYLEPFKLHAFSGEEQIECEPLAGDVTDLGIIYDRKKCRVKFEVLSSFAADDTQEFALTEGTHFLFCAQGSFLCEDLLVSKEHMLQLEGSGNLKLRSQLASSSCFLITILLL